MIRKVLPAATPPHDTPPRVLRKKAGKRTYLKGKALIGLARLRHG